MRIQCSLALDAEAEGHYWADVLRRFWKDWAVGARHECFRCVATIGSSSKSLRNVTGVKDTDVTFSTGTHIPKWRLHLYWDVEAPGVQSELLAGETAQGKEVTAA